MAMEPTTLYKLVALYMLDKVNFPMTNAQITGFFLEKGYTQYFNVQQVLAELIQTGLLSMETAGNTSYYHMTAEGSETLTFFENDIPGGMVEDINTFLLENKFELRNEVGTTADYYQSSENDYIVHCQVKEGSSILIELNLSVPGKEEAACMCSNWKGASQEIYDMVMKSLLKENAEET